MLLIILLLVNTEAAKILAVFPTPSISHQVAFRPFTQELVKRGHELVIITPNPAFGDNDRPDNLTEIDVRDISYSIFRKQFTEKLKGVNDPREQVYQLVEVLTNIFEAQIRTNEVQDIINKKYKFDLVISEAYYRIAGFFANIYKVPAIFISSFGFSASNPETMGVPVHPLYPSNIRQRIFNLTLWEEGVELITEIYVHRLVYGHEPIENEILKKYVKEDTPSVSQVFENVHLTLLNVPSYWEMNRPVTPGVIFMGLPELRPQKQLPKEIEFIMNNSINGVIYVSFGTNVIESLLPMDKINVLAKVFSRLPYDVIWKWNSDKLPEVSKNVKLFNWLPQTDLLRHPKMKLFLTQGGIQSSFEAIAAGVPMIGLPLSLDQGFNTELYLYYKVGLKLQFETVTEEILESAVVTVIENDWYHSNVLRLRALMYDQPYSSLELAVWWTEHLLRHGAKHLQAPAANITWSMYLEIELVSIFVMLVVLSIGFIVLVVNFGLRTLKVKM